MLATRRDAMNAPPPPTFKKCVTSSLLFRPSVVQDSRACKFLPSSCESNPRLWVEAFRVGPVYSSETRYREIEVVRVWFSDGDYIHCSTEKSYNHAMLFRDNEHFQARLRTRGGGEPRLRVRASGRHRRCGPFRFLLLSSSDTHSCRDSF